MVDPTEFVHIFLKNSKELIEFLEHIHKNQISTSKIISNTLLELYINSFSDPIRSRQKLPTLQQSPTNFKDDFITENNSSTTTATTAAANNKSTISLQEKKALEFLTNNYSQYDTNLALVVCQLYNFKAGMLYLYEKNQMYLRILQFNMEMNDYINILDTCKRYGTHDSNLWIQALQYFSKREEYNCNEYIMQILANIEKYNLLSPLMVIKILSQNSTLTVDTVKEYLLKRMRKEEKEIEEEEKDK